MCNLLGLPTSENSASAHAAKLFNLFFLQKGIPNRPYFLSHYPQNPLLLISLQIASHVLLFLLEASCLHLYHWVIVSPPLIFFYYLRNPSFHFVSRFLLVLRVMSYVCINMSFVCRSLLFVSPLFAVLFYLSYIFVLLIIYVCGCMFSVSSIYVLCLLRVFAFYILCLVVFLVLLPRPLNLRLFATFYTDVWALIILIFHVISVF